MNVSKHLLVFASLFGLVSESLAQSLVVTVQNPQLLARPSETISVPWAEVERALPHSLLQHLEVRDAAGHVLAYQVTNMRPLAKDPHNTGLAYGDLLFQHDFALGEATAAFAITQISEVAPVFPSKTFARYVPERLDDFAWENDKIAHRTYGLALAAPDTAKTGKEVLVSSGLDVWCKRVPYLIVDRWYNKGHNHYHKDEGEGMDMYQTGNSRGCGGAGIWDGTTLAVPSNYTAWKVLANGPIRSIFELSFSPWEAHGRMISETKRFTVDAGHNLDQIESTFTVVEGPGTPIDVGIGLNKDSADPGQEPKTEVGQVPANGSMTQWVVEKTNGSIGTAVIMAADHFTGYAEDSTNVLLLAKAAPGEPLRYLVGAGWSKAGEFMTREAWEGYVSNYAARLHTPVEVTFATRP